MKQTNRCPNCGALLPKSRTNTIICEYCGSEFVNPNPVIAIGEVDKETLKEEINDFKTVKIMPFGVNDIPRFEDGTPVTSENVKKNYFCERNADGKLVISTLTYHSNAPVGHLAEHIQLDTGHTMSRVGNSYMARIDPRENPQIVLQAMKRAVHKEDEEIPYEYFHDNKENQWKVRCFPW